jgi:hypothetical protein
MVNPYISYALSFTIALLLYMLGWSLLYPPLQYPVVIFISATIVMHVAIGMVLFKRKLITFKKLPPSTLRKPLVITAFIYFLWAMEFLYAGGIPLLKIILKQPYDYRTFGIPSLHVFIVTFSSFYTALLFHQYLSSRSRGVLILFFINLMAALLIYNRGMALFNIAHAAFLYLLSVKRISIVKAVAGVFITIMLLYIFGVLGSLRVSREARIPYSNEEFLKIGQASPAFRKSAIADEFFWSYIYISSPLANLQHNMSNASQQHLSWKALGWWVNDQLLPDFVSKRVHHICQNEAPMPPQIPGPFNASTIYTGSYFQLGLVGIALMAIIIACMPFLYLLLIPQHSPYFLSGMAIMNTIFIFMIFENTIHFTGLSFQLFYPVLFYFINKAFPRANLFYHSG